MQVVWRVVAEETPTVLRRCPRCDGERPFRSSDRFRVNAQGRRLDVWLVYRCEACDFTWNLEVLARVTPEAIGAARLDAFHRNDRAAAWACAFAAARAPVRYRVERPDLAPAQTIRLEMPYPCGIRLDRLLAAELRLPRAALERRLAAGRLRVTPWVLDPLRRPAADGQLISYDAA